MSWIKESERKSWLQQLILSVLKHGTIPKHVAFIMDGNRRFAQKNNFDRAKGHLKGFDKLAETLEWCLDLGITEVTVYAFSIENFKRSKEEVDCLMELAREKFARLMQEKELLEKHGVRIRVVGNIKLLPQDIQEMIAEAVLITSNHDRATLNVAFSYTSRDEICCAMREAIDGVQMGLIRDTDITEELLEQCFYTNESPDPDLLVRTSGEVRLSDFLLWQTSFSVLSFMKVLWPEFSVWHLYFAVLHFQYHYEHIRESKEFAISSRKEAERQSDYNCVIDELNKKPNGLVRTEKYIDERVRQYTADRLERQKAFISHVCQKRRDYLKQLCPHII